MDIPGEHRRREHTIRIETQIRSQLKQFRVAWHWEESLFFRRKFCSSSQGLPRASAIVAFQNQSRREEASQQPSWVSRINGQRDQVAAPKVPAMNPGHTLVVREPEIGTEKRVERGAIGAQQ